jgi:carbamoyl-phosphate synthase/aspartate carbamoyltransferase
MAGSLQRKDASGRPVPPTLPALGRSEQQKAMVLELQDGMLFQGYSFGAERSTAGELVFSTGMVGYPESLTDPSYRGQILVMTFPLIGNYGVPSMQTEDALLAGLPAYFEASDIHVAGLVVASYAGEEYSHFLAHSSLGQWLKEQGIPAIYGVDTRAVTKRIRDEGSMLGKLMIQRDLKEPAPNGQQSAGQYSESSGPSWPSGFESIDWADPNVKNLVDDGKGAP